MPALVFLKRKWLIACDDFVFPCAIEATVRTILFAVSFVLIWLNIEDCVESELVNIFIYVVAGYLFVTLCLSIGIAIASGRGSVLEVEKRKYLSSLLYIKILSLFCDAFLASYGLWLFTHTNGVCYVKEIFVKVTTVVVFIYFVIVIILVGVCYDTLGSSKFWNVEVNSNSLNFFKKAQYIWRLRLKLFCCCADISDDNDYIYVEISTFLASFLNGIDLVPTDILAGIITVSQKHALEKRKNMLVHLPDSSELLELSPVSEWMTPENAMYFLRIAKSTYGWMAFFDVFQPWKLCVLSSHAKCCPGCCSAGSEDNIDNCCHLNSSAVQKITGFSESEIIYSSFRNNIYEPAFYVAVDHQRKFVIVAIRGTSSISDMITDVDADVLYFPNDGPNKFRCHRGVLRSALFVQKKISELRVFETLFSENPSYVLALTGHSLGGSVAAVLALFYKPKYPNLQCYAYGPLASVSALGVKETLDCVLTVIVGVDLAPRLTSSACVALRQEIMESLKQNTDPKYQILSQATWYHLQRKFKYDHERPVREVHENQIYENDESTPQEEGSVVGDDFLYAPGRILYFERKSCYQPYWLTGLNLQKIIIHPDMISDHQPHRMTHMLEMYVKSLTHDTQVTTN